MTLKIGDIVKIGSNYCLLIKGHGHDVFRNIILNKPMRLGELTVKSGEKYEVYGNIADIIHAIPERISVLK